MPAPYNSPFELASLRVTGRGYDSVHEQSTSLAVNILTPARPLEAHDLHQIDIQSSLAEVFSKAAQLPDPRAEVDLKKALFP